MSNYLQLATEQFAPLFLTFVFAITANRFSCEKLIAGLLPFTNGHIFVQLY